MKWWTKLMIPVLVLGLVGVADAKQNNAGNGVRGKITNIDGKDITISKGKKNAGNGTVIHVTKKTLITIDGVVGKKLEDLQVGEKVKITASAGTATQITATSKHHKKNNA